MVLQTDPGIPRLQVFLKDRLSSIYGMPLLNCRSPQWLRLIRSLIRGSLLMMLSVIFLMLLFGTGAPVIRMMALILLRIFRQLLNSPAYVSSYLLHYPQHLMLQFVLEVQRPYLLPGMEQILPGCFIGTIIQIFCLSMRSV